MDRNEIKMSARDYFKSNQGGTALVCEEILKEIS
jgi:hypothetical protein